MNDDSTVLGKIEDQKEAQYYAEAAAREEANEEFAVSLDVMVKAKTHGEAIQIVKEIVDADQRITDLHLFQ